MSGMLGSDFVASSPADVNDVDGGAAAIRDIKARVKAFCGVLFDLETGLFKAPQTQITVTSTAPSSPNIGDVYYDLTTSAAYVYLSSGWQLLIQPSLPVGTMVQHTGTIASITSSFAGLGGTWVHADGRAVSRVTYAAYFALIGTNEGAGDGTTTFNIPDTRNLMPVGASADNAGLAKSTITDGSTLVKSRGYTHHRHDVSSTEVMAGSGSGVAGSCQDDNTRPIPPFRADPFVVRIG